MDGYVQGGVEDQGSSGVGNLSRSAQTPARPEHLAQTAVSSGSAAFMSPGPASRPSCIKCNTGFDGLG
jgi:hypothetical protein